jgi:hypothetical protein
MSTRVTSTVIAAASSYDLVDLATVKDELGITNGTSDVKLKRYITAASAAIANHCNRVFVKETVSDRFDIRIPRLQWGGEAVLQLNRFPAITVASVTENSTALVQDTDFRIEAPSGTLIRTSSDGTTLTWAQTPIIVQYDGGYVSIPADLADAAVRLVRTRWFAKDRDPMARQVNIPGVLDVAYWVPTGADAGNMPPDVVDLLSNYAVPQIA